MSLSICGSVVKNPPAMQETQEMGILSMSPDDPLAKETAAHASILAWRIPGTEEPPWGRKRVRHDLATNKNKFILDVLKY